MAEYNKLKNSVRFPTSLIIRGEDLLGIEIAKSLLEQGGFVILIDNGVTTVEKYLPLIDIYRDNILIMDYAGLVNLKNELRRLDYVFYLNHQNVDQNKDLSSQDFLQASNYLDAVLDLTVKFDAKFLLTTSIKAHQMLVSDKTLSLDYSYFEEHKYTHYSNLEIQRYAESLVNEYRDRVGVNARIVRIGTLLGKGMEVDINSSLVKMIINALNGEKIYIPADGLETDFYIHYLDAAYGIIKAQFSHNTKGKIYSLCNTDEVSLLSIGYKLMELLPNATEIAFDPSDNRLPPLKLYKPATNLNEIGWKQRVSLDRSLQETIDFIKQRIKRAGGKLEYLNSELIPINPVKHIEEKSLKEKILDIFFIKEQEKQESIAEINAKNKKMASSATQTALERLIAEKKQEERLRKGNIILANNQLRSSIQPKSKFSTLKRIDIGIANYFWKFKKRFNWLKNMTVLDFVVISLGIVAFVVFYLNIIAPCLSFTKNLYFINKDLSAYEYALQNHDINEAHGYIKTISGNLREGRDRLTQLSELFKLLKKQELYSDLQLLIGDSMDFCNRLESIHNGVTPWTQYYADFNPGFIKRLDGSTYLSIDSSSDYSLYVRNIRNTSSDFNINLKKNKEMLPEILSKYKKIFGDSDSNVERALTSLNTEFNNLDKISNIIPYSNTLFGVDAPRNYLILIQDNLRYTAGGGEIVGVIVLNVTDGSIRNVDVLNLASFSNSLMNFSTKELTELKLSSSNLITLSNGRLRDVALITDSDIQLANIKKYVETQTSKSIDLIVSANMNVFKELIGERGLTIGNMIVNKNNLTDYIVSKSNDVSTENDRNQLILNTISSVFEERLNDIDKNEAEIANAINLGIQKGDLRFFSSNLMINKFLDGNIKKENFKDTVFIGANYDQKNFKLAEEPSITLTGKINIGKDGKIVKNLEFVTGNLNDLQNLLFCAPYNTKDLKFSRSGTDLVSYALSYESNKSCGILLENADKKYSVSYYNEFKVDEEDEYQLELTVAPGIDFVYDIEFEFDAGTDGITAETENYIKQNSSYLYRGSNENIKAFKFKLK